MNKQLAISGLGWLGMPLASHFEKLGYTVRGSVTQADKVEMLREKGYDAYKLHAMETGLQGEVSAFLDKIDTYIIMIPPGLRNHSGVNYVAKMNHLLQAVLHFKVPHVVFISSISVYGSDQGKVTEKTLPKPDSEAGKQLLEVEQLWFSAALDTTIIRFGGLLGGTRQPVKHLAGRTGLTNGNAPVNLIHREDCLAIISAIVQQQLYGHIINAVHPHHPPKEAYYTKKAQELGLTPPQYTDGDAWINKQVDSVLLPELLHYSFQHAI